ncbi:MAG: thymidylate kinase [Ruminococcaceae bacterium]|nr:thymidylate kinase [Oscillospiraceae bacterium]
MGRFIVIEGLDGSGKTTQGKLLAERLRNEGKTVRELSFPRYGEKSCSLVEMYLSGELGKNPDDTNAYSASMLYAADRYISYVTDWKKDIENESCIVLATRYTTANAYHQLSKLDKAEWAGFLSWLWDFEFGKLGLPKPDCVILLRAQREISSANVKCRSEATGQKIDIHEMDTDYLDRCKAAADYAAQNDGWISIDCTAEGKMLPVEKINDKIRAALDI